VEVEVPTTRTRIKVKVDQVKKEVEGGRRQPARVGRSGMVDVKKEAPQAKPKKRTSSVRIKKESESEGEDIFEVYFSLSFPSRANESFPRSSKSLLQNCSAASESTGSNGWATTSMAGNQRRTWRVVRRC
jgi:hypothetical protein